MKKTAALGCLVATLLMANAAISHADDAAYEIKLNRTGKVGEKFDITEKHEALQKMTMVIDGKPVDPREQKHSVEIEATLEITALDKTGRESAYHLVIKKLLFTE